MDSPARKLRIGISGSYGGMNLGDEAIFEGILRELRASIPAEITVFS
jgi:polysaccharide pyruvyl transferase WcaK-like protein